MTWPSAAPDSVKDLVKNRFRISGFPTLILLDPDGIVIEATTSALEGDALMARLEKLLRSR